MSTRFQIRVRLFTPVALLLSGCAANYGWHTETAGADFEPGTHVLGELIMRPTREQVLSGDGIMRGWAGKLRELGYSETDIVDGSEATVWAFCFGHNSGVPLCTHHGHYLVHIPVEFRDGLHFDDDSPDTSGDLVEIELMATPSGYLVGRWVGVYRVAGAWAGCRVETLERGPVSTTLTLLGGVGPPRANWLECDDVSADGWTRRPVAGAPLSQPTPVSEWVRKPAR